MLTFYGGIGEVGGNKILLESGDTRIFVDFGRSFGKERSYFDEPFLSPRNERILLSLGILPRIDGLYRMDEGECTIDAVLISHPHMDHCDYIRYIKDEVPIYCGEATRNLIISREISGRGGGDYCIASMTKSYGEEVHKQFYTFHTGDRIRIGSIDIEPIHVDHSIPASYGFLIYTPEHTIAYTGDFRFHGPLGWMTEDFIRRAEEEHPDVLIIEGTNIAEAKVASEAEVKEKSANVVSKARKLVLASFSPVDIDRLRTFYEVAMMNDRILAIPAKQAYILSSIERNIKLFDLCSPEVAVFFREKKVNYAWEEEVKRRCNENVVSSSEIRDVQSRYLLVASFYDMNEIAEIMPEPGSIYILSESEPVNEEAEIGYEKLLNWLEFHGVPLYHIHSSGHASPHQLRDAISRIGPRETFLIHTERAELFRRYIQDLNTRVTIPEVGAPYAV